MRGLWFGAVMTAMIVAEGAHARDLAYSDIAGTWCGDTTNCRFTRNNLKVTFRANKSNRVLKIKKYEFSETWINVIYADGGNTAFAEFGRDGRTMAQQPNTGGDKGPRRPFRRCR